MTASGSRIAAALEVLQADANDPNRQAMWRYGVQHALSVIRNHLLPTIRAMPDGMSGDERYDLGWDDSQAAILAALEAQP